MAKSKSAANVEKMLEKMFQYNELETKMEQEGRDINGDKKILDIPVEQIKTNPYQPRKTFNEEALKELSISIAENGLIHPISVTPKENGIYTLVAGERRLRASIIADMKTIPAFIVELTDKQLAELALLENIQREDLNPIEIANAMDSLIREFAYTQDELSQRLGKSREYVANLLRLLKLPKEIQYKVENKSLSSSHARALLSLKDEDVMKVVADKIEKDSMSVRDVEQYVKTLKDEEERQVLKEKAKKKQIFEQYEEDLKRVFNMNSIYIKNKEVRIVFKNEEEIIEFIRKMEVNW